MNEKKGIIRNRILIVVFCLVIAISAVIAVLAYTDALSEAAAPAEPVRANLTIIQSSEQDSVTRPAGFPDPEENWIKLPDGENLALGKEVSSGEATEVYVAANAVDGELTSYWESRGVPAEIIIDLADLYTIQTVAIRLNPAPIWEPRNQNFELLTSTDGSDFTVAVEDTRYDFDPDTGNIARIDFDPISARYVKLICSAKSSGRSNGAQAAEICVYE